jgi:hypothetical protein
MKRKSSASTTGLVAGRIEQSILLLRGHKVMLDADLAELYGVETKALKRAVKRNASRFPDDFMLELDDQEFENLRYRSGTSRWGGARYRPYAFTEQGVAMLSANSSQFVMSWNSSPPMQP